MGLYELLAESESAITKKWFDKVVETYPPDTARFLKKQKDPFANPVGSTTFKGLQTLFRELLKEKTDEDRIKEAIDPIIRIRAVQTNLSTGTSVGFPYFLKTLVRDYLAREKDDSMIRELMEFELKIDKMAILAFEIYVACRETVFQLKTNLERERIYKAFSRAGLVEKIQDGDPDLKEI